MRRTGGFVEWFPALSGRENLTTWQGTEWIPDGFPRAEATLGSSCRSAGACRMPTITSFVRAAVLSSALFWTDFVRTCTSKQRDERCREGPVLMGNPAHGTHAVDGESSARRDFLANCGSDEGLMDTARGTFAVIGGAGFVGSHVVDQLLAGGAAEIRVLDNLKRGTRENLRDALGDERVTLIEGSVTDPGAVQDVVRDTDGVFHLAALWLDECVNDPRAAVEVNVGGTFNVIEASQRAGVRGWCSPRRRRCTAMPFRSR